MRGLALGNRSFDWHYIEPGKTGAERLHRSFNSRLRDECLNEHVFLTLLRRARPSKRGVTTTITCGRTAARRLDTNEFALLK